jgi:putative acetyltransferase
LFPFLPMSVVVREETPADISAIETVTAAAFLNAPHTSHSEQVIVNGLRTAGKLAISLVAEVGGTVIGHVALSPVSVSSGASGWFGVGPISVAPEHQRHGVGSRLMREALRLLRERHAAGCVLLGDPEYYGRFGFRVDARLVLPDVPPEYFQVIYFGACRTSGVVSYHEAFKLQSQ